MKKFFYLFNLTLIFALMAPSYAKDKNTSDPEQIIQTHIDDAVLIYA